MPNQNGFSSNAFTRAVWRKHETIEQAIKRRGTLVRQLLSGDDSAQQLAEELAACKGDSPCESPICPMCVRELRYWFIREAVGCIKDLRSTNRSALRHKVVRFLGIPLEAHRVGTQSLPDLKRLNKTLKKRFERDQFPLCLPAWIFPSTSITTQSPARAGSRTCMVWWSGSLRLKLKQRCQPITRLTGARRGHFTSAVAIACRPCFHIASSRYFSRHSGYRDSKNGRKNSQPEPLKGWQMQELGVWLDQYELADRYLLRGCRKQGSGIVINPTVKAELLGHQDVSESYALIS